MFLYDPTEVSQTFRPLVWSSAIRRPSGSPNMTLPSATATPGMRPPLPGEYCAPLLRTSPAYEGVYFQMTAPVAASIAKTWPSGGLIV